MSLSQDRLQHNKVIVAQTLLDMTKRLTFDMTSFEYLIREGIILKSDVKNITAAIEKIVDDITEKR